jgi:hypothetical protein
MDKKLIIGIGGAVALVGCAVVGVVRLRKNLNAAKNAGMTLREYNVSVKEAKKAAKANPIQTNAPVFTTN